MAEFNGTITVSENPVATTAAYSATFNKSPDEKTKGYSNLKMTHRADGGFYRASFDIQGPLSFLSDFMDNGLGREVKIRDNDGKVSWEGYIDEVSFDAGSVVYRTNLSEMSNAVWVRFRVRGTSTTSRSKVQTNAESIARFGRKEFVLSGGELESTDIADDVALQYLKLNEWPRPSPVQIDPSKELSEYPVLSVNCKGWFDTLNWCTYNQTTSTDNQAVNEQIDDILADTNVAQFVATTEIAANAVSVSKEYDADRRGGDIIGDLARLGDVNSNRYIAYMAEDRKCVYEQAQPPEDPE